MSVLSSYLVQIYGIRILCSILEKICRFWAKVNISHLHIEQCPQSVGPRARKMSPYGSACFTVIDSFEASTAKWDQTDEIRTSRDVKDCICLWQSSSDDEAMRLRNVRDALWEDFILKCCIVKLKHRILATSASIFHLAWTLLEHGRETAITGIRKPEVSSSLPS